MRKCPLKSKDKTVKLDMGGAKADDIWNELIQNYNWILKIAPNDMLL